MFVVFWVVLMVLVVWVVLVVLVVWVFSNNLSLIKTAME
jgi:hypothetical protein